MIFGCLNGSLLIIIVSNVETTSNLYLGFRVNKQIIPTLVIEYSIKLLFNQINDIKFLNKFN